MHTYLLTYLLSYLLSYLLTVLLTVLLESDSDLPTVAGNDSWQQYLVARSSSNQLTLAADAGSWRWQLTLAVDAGS